MTAHTPGRWFVEHGSVRVLADDPRATIVCEVTGSPSDLGLWSEEWDHYDDDQPIYGRDRTVLTVGDVRRAIAAIAKATGASA